MRHANAFSSVHCFSHNAITIFTSHGRAADHSLQGDSDRYIRLHEQILKKVPFNTDFSFSLLFFWVFITADNVKVLSFFYRLLELKVLEKI